MDRTGSTVSQRSRISRAMARTQKKNKHKKGAWSCRRARGRSVRREIGGEEERKGERGGRGPGPAYMPSALDSVVVNGRTAGRTAHDTTQEHAAGPRDGPIGARWCDAGASALRTVLRVVQHLSTSRGGLSRYFSRKYRKFTVQHSTNKG